MLNRSFIKVWSFILYVMSWEIVIKTTKAYDDISKMSGENRTFPADPLIKGRGLKLKCSGYSKRSLHNVFFGRFFSGWFPIALSIKITMPGLVKREMRLSLPSPSARKSLKTWEICPIQSAIQWYWFKSSNGTVKMKRAIFSGEDFLKGYIFTFRI